MADGLPAGGGGGICCCCCCCCGLLATFNACRVGGKVPPGGNGNFFLLMHTIKCIANANSNGSKRLSTGSRSTIFHISRNVVASTPDFINNGTASDPYTNDAPLPSSSPPPPPSAGCLAYCGNKLSYRSRSCGVIEYGSIPTKARLGGDNDDGGGCCCCWGGG